MDTKLKIESTINRAQNTNLDMTNDCLKRTSREDEVYWIQNDAKFSAVRQGFE